MATDKIKKSDRTATVRDSNIELYRIIAMLLIIAHHYVVNSGLTAADGPIYANLRTPASLFLLLWGAWGKIGINCFVFITGWFMCRSRISAKKFAKLFGEMMFYKIVINAVFWITGYAPFTLRNVINVLIPFKMVAQNFTGTFLFFFLCIPFLNVLVHNLSEKQHIRLLGLSLLIYVFFGTFPPFSVTMNYVSWYCVLFFVASYMRLYPRPLYDNKTFWGWCTVGCLLLCCATVVVRAWLGRYPYRFVTDCNTLLGVLTGVSTFMFFKNLTIRPSKFINTVSATTFGVFLIHANSDTMRKWLWKDVLHNVEMYDSPWMYVHAVLGVVGIFIVCCGIDLLRIRFVEKPFFAWWDRHWDAVVQKWKAWETRLCEKCNIGDAPPPAA